MRSVRQISGRILHREKPDGLTVTFSTDKIDELYTEALALIPFDSPSTTNNKEWLARMVREGRLDQATLALDGIPIGLITYAVVGELHKELLISTASISDTTFDYLPFLKTFALKIAAQNDCKFIRFHTARKGLVKKALSLGFHVSEIVLRLTL